MEIRNKIIGTIFINDNLNLKKIIKKLNINIKDKIDTYLKNDEYKSFISIKNLKDLNTYDILKLNIYYNISNSLDITIEEPVKVLNYNELKDLIKLLKMLKTKVSNKINVISCDTDFLLKICDYVYIKKCDIILKEGNKYDVLSDEKLLNDYKIKIPEVLSFRSIVLQKKGIKLNYRDDINDLIKDIYRLK